MFPYRIHWNSTKSKLVAFSLVEVTIALGVVSFAVLAVLALLPTGLSTLRAGMEDTVRAQIVKAISSQTLLTDFLLLEDTFYEFDDEGQVVDSDGHYQVTVRVGDPIYPGLDTNLISHESLQQLTIQIVNRSRETNTQTIYVANSGK
jgi:uncharacterized protein (TIGR02598 family)